MSQRKWTIEVLADYDDASKNDYITDKVRRAAAYIAANTNLLQDSVKPKCACWSDDFFGDHEEISLLAASIPDAATVLDEQEAPSSELIAAAEAMKGS